MKTAATISLLVLVLTACGEKHEDATPVLDRAIEALGGREALASVKSVYVRHEGVFEPPGGSGAKAAYFEEILLTLPDRLARRRVVAGLRSTAGIDNESSWIRNGAAVADRTGQLAAEDRADRDDLLCLLVLPILEPGFTVSKTGDVVCVTRSGDAERRIIFDPESGLPVRIVRETRDAHGKTGRLVRSFEGYVERGPIRFPSSVDAELGGSRLTLTATRVEINPGDSRGLTTGRPRDRREMSTGPIRRITVPGGGFFAVTHRGPLIDLAKVDLLLEQGLARNWVKRLGPNRRVFERYPGSDGEAVVATLVPVTIVDQGAGATLPRGIELANLAETEALSMTFTGGYPRDIALETMLVNYGKDLGLTPVGPARYLILSDPEAGDPADLEQEIRLPVRRAE